MNCSAEQTNRMRTASRFTPFVCPALQFIPHEPRKKDSPSLHVNKYHRIVNFNSFLLLYYSSLKNYSKQTERSTSKIWDTYLII